MKKTNKITALLLLAAMLLSLCAGTALYLLLVQTCFV